MLNCEMISQPKIKDKKIICTTRSHASHDVNACIEAMKPDEILCQGRIPVEIMEDNQISETYCLL